MKLKPKELDKLYAHYTGNCVSCPRCGFYQDIEQGKAGAVEAYVKYMKEEHGQTIKTTS